MATTPKTTGRNSGKSATPTTTSGHDTAVQLAQVHRIVWLGQNVITTEPLAALYDAAEQYIG